MLLGPDPGAIGAERAAVEPLEETGEPIAHPVLPVAARPELVGDRAVAVARTGIGEDLEVQAGRRGPAEMDVGQAALLVVDGGAVPVGALGVADGITNLEA